MAAARGLRESDGDPEAIANPADRERNRRLGWLVMASATATAILATGLFTFAA